MKIIYTVFFFFVIFASHNLIAQEKKSNKNIKMSSEQFSELIKKVVENRSNRTTSKTQKVVYPKLKKIKIPNSLTSKTIEETKEIRVHKKIKDSVVYITKTDTIFNKNTIVKNHTDTIISKVPYYVYENDTVHRKNVNYINHEYTYTKENLSDVNKKLDEIESQLSEIENKKYIDTNTEKVKEKDTVYIKTYAENPEIAPKIDSLKYYIGKNRNLLERINVLSDSLNKKEIPVVEKTTYIEPKVKVEKQKTYSIYFPIGQTSIDSTEQARFFNFYNSTLGKEETLKAVIVNGYASPVGKLSVNQRVSANRTMSAVNMLKSKGINESLIEFNVKGIDYNAKNNSEAQRVDIVLKY